MLLAFLALLAGRIALPPIDRDESRYAQATRQMLETGDYVDPRFQDHPRWVQPAATYWLQAAAVALADDTGSRDIWPHRLPSLLAGTVAAGLTAAIGLALFTPPVALGGAALLAASLLFNFEGRIATTDATLLACILAGELGLVRIWLSRMGTGAGGGAPRWAPWLFWAALGLCVMVKGPAGVLVLGATTLALAASEWRWRWLARLRPLPGVLLFLAIALPWMVAIGIRTNGAFFVQAVGHNMLGKMAQAQEAHGAPPGYYLLLFTIAFWPGSLWVARALPAVVAQRRADPFRFLLCWAVPSWLVFECVPTKLPHYVLPTYPALALLGASGLAAMTLRPARPAGPRWLRAARRAGTAYGGIWLGVSAAFSLGPCLLAWRLTGRFSLVAAGTGVIALALLVVGWRLSAGRHRRAALACVVAGALLAQGMAFGRVLPSLDPIWLSPRVAALVRATRPCPGSVVASGSYNEPSLVFLLGTPTQLTDPYTAARSLLQDRACALALIGDQSMAAFQAALARAGASPRELGAVRGIDYSNGRRLTLHLFTLAPP